LGFAFAFTIISFPIKQGNEQDDEQDDDDEQEDGKQKGTNIIKFQWFQVCPTTEVIIVRLKCMNSI
jgi:hypothetical protein